MTCVLVGLCNSNIHLLGYECVSESHVLSNLFGYLGWLTSIRVKAASSVHLHISSLNPVVMIALIIFTGSAAGGIGSEGGSFACVSLRCRFNC